MERRVVITGMGIWSCLGTDLDTVKESLYAGKSGIGIQPERLEYGYRSALTGIVEEPVITKQMLDRHTRAGMSEEAKYAYMASVQAFQQAEISDEYLRENEVGCIFGNDSSAKPVIEAAKIMDEKHDSAMLGYGIIFQSMNSTVNMNLSTIFHLRGINFTVSSACASGSHSIGLGYMMIKQGLQEMVLCGGAQETNYYSMASFDALSASLSAWTNLPRQAVLSTETAMDSFQVVELPLWYWRITSMPKHEAPIFLRKWWDMVSPAMVGVSVSHQTREVSLP